jgi:hypothetical protein
MHEDDGDGIEGSLAPRQMSASDQLVMDTFSFQMEYLYHIMERYIDTIGRPVPYVSAHLTITSHAVLEEMRKSKPGGEEQGPDNTPTDVDTPNSAFKKYGFWASFPRSMPSVSFTKERLQGALKFLFPVW